MHIEKTDALIDGGGQAGIGTGMLADMVILENDPLTQDPQIKSSHP